MKTLQNNFYFIRHGEVDYSLHENEEDAVLTQQGKKQAETMRPIIENLPIKTICVSPLLRALETQKILTQNIDCPVVVVEALRECTGAIWSEMVALESGCSFEELSENVKHFMHRAVTGIQHALTYPGPVLIVAHGGVHFALCQSLQIEAYDKKIDYCIPAHFLAEKDYWTAKHLAKR